MYIAGITVIEAEFNGSILKRLCLTAYPWIIFSRKTLAFQRDRKL